MIKHGRWAWVPVLAGPTPALAHSPVPGFEGFYIGLIHPFSTPSQALLMVSSALLVGGFASDKARWPLLAFAVLSLFGLLIGQQIAEIDPYLFALTAATCAFAALAPGKITPLAIGVLAAAGFLIGQVSIPDGGPFKDRLFTMSGSIIGANLGLLYLFGLVHVARQRYTWPWVDIAFRVVAAWVGAISLVMLALGYAQVTQVG